MAKIAIVDLLFNWPPDGGARVDIKEMASRLASAHEVRLFCPDFTDYFPRGEVSEDLALAIERLSFTKYSFNLITLPQKFRERVDAFSPDHVFVADGWHMKPHVVNALKKYRPILRMYAYELLCIKDYGTLFKHGSICTKNVLSNPISCMFCSLKFNRWKTSPLFTHEYIMSMAFLPSYRRRVLSALRNSSAVIVYNSFAKNILDRQHPNVLLAPSGVDTDFFKPAPGKAPGDPPVILMSSRIGDPAKGFSVFIEAVKILTKRKENFRAIVPTYSDMGPPPPGLEYVGWHRQDELPLLYTMADVCVVPSVWLEPFGIAAVEAMACGKPVIASDVGGLQTIVEDAVTGLLVPPGDPEALAEKIALLLKSQRLRSDLGREGRKRAREFDWEKIMEEVYFPLFSRD